MLRGNMKYVLKVNRVEICQKIMVRRTIHIEEIACTKSQKCENVQ